MSEEPESEARNPVVREEAFAEDFLFHYFQGGEKIRKGQWVEAKDYLEKAAQIEPDNPKCQNLLGLVYFNLGLYQRSIQVYRNLIEKYPNDATLRVNLATVYFKADELDKAESDLLWAIELNPDLQKAHRTLAVVLMKKGETERVREHLLKAGITDAEHWTLSMPPESEPMPQEVELEADRGRVSAVEEQIAKQALPEELPPEIGVMGAAIQSEPQPIPRILETPFHLEKEYLVANFVSRVFVRLPTLIGVEGDLTFTAVKKRFGGEETKFPFDGGELTMVMVVGQGGLRFTAHQNGYQIHQQGEEPGYFLEEFVFAFTDSVFWENGRLASKTEDEDLAIFHLQGPAQVVLTCPGEIHRKRLDGTGKFLLNAKKLVGWSGTLNPKIIKLARPLPEGLWIELSGVGEVFYLT